VKGTERRHKGYS